MKQKIQFFFCIIILIELLGCATPIPYTPKASKSFSENQNVIKRILSEQPVKFAPNNIIITNEYIQINKITYKRSFHTYGITTLPELTTIYFSSIGESKIYHKGKYFIVMIYDTNKNFRYKVFTPSEEDARQFVDAVYSLKKAKNE